MKIRKLIPLLLCICTLLSFAAPFRAYAEDGQGDAGTGSGAAPTTLDPQVDELLKAAAQCPQDSDEAVAKRDKIIALLYEKLPDLEKDPTVQGGYNIITEILKDSDVDMAGATSAVKTLWQKYYKTEAMSLGVNFNSSADITYTDENGTQHTIKNSGNAKSDAGVKVNILTWNKSKDSQGNALDKINQGVISKMLTSASTALSSFADTIRAFAVALAITFGVIGIMNMVQDRNASNEMLTREFVKLFLGVWFIYNYKFFALLIIRAGTLVTETIMSAVGGSSNHAAQYALVKSLYTILSGTSDITSLSTSFMTGIGQMFGDVLSSMSGALGDITGFFGSGIVQMSSSLVIYAVAIEIVIRYIFTPIAIADLYSEKWRSNGWMWLKKLFAVSIQGAVIFMIIYLTDLLKSEIGGTFSIVTNTAINLTMLGMFAKSRQIANDLIGVH